MRNNFKSEKGIIALLTIIIIGFTTLTMALSSSFIGLGELNSGFTNIKGNKAMVLTEGCLEEALNKLRLNSGYSGESLVFKKGSCIISVSSNLNDRTILVEGQLENYYKKIEVDLTLNNNQININSWEEKNE
jgi:hypothetical protein